MGGVMLKEVGDERQAPNPSKSIECLPRRILPNPLNVSPMGVAYPLDFDFWTFSTNGQGKGDHNNSMIEISEIFSNKSKNSSAN